MPGGGYVVFKTRRFDVDAVNSLSFAYPGVIDLSGQIAPGFSGSYLQSRLLFSTARRFFPV
jgi:hypothetical protein